MCNTLCKLKKNIPDDIEYRLLKLGSRKRYDEQLHHLKQLNSNNYELQRLIELIHNKRKAYDQEGYINGTRFDDALTIISDK